VQGKPFVGSHGEILDLMLSAADRTREDVFLTNTVCCKTPDSEDPVKEALAACRPRMMEEIYLVDPVVIITLGKVATTYFLGKHRLPDVVGKMYPVELPGRVTPWKTTVLPTWHPEKILREGMSAALADDVFRHMCLGFETADIHREVAYEEID